MLLTYISSCSHRLLSLRPEELRLGEVAELLAEYRTLVAEGGKSHVGPEDAVGAGGEGHGGLMVGGAAWEADAASWAATGGVRA